MRTEYWQSTPQAYWQSSAPGALSTLVTSVVLYLLTRDTLMSPGKDETQVCGWIYIYIYIYILTLYAFQKISCIYIKLKDIHKIVIFRLFTNLVRTIYIQQQQNKIVLWIEIGKLICLLTLRADIFLITFL